MIKNGQGALFKKGWFVNRCDAKALLFFLLPSLIGFMLFYFVPFLISVYYSFIDSIFNGEFVRLQNYISLFHSSSFILASNNTLLFTGLCVPLNIVLSLFLATLLNGHLYLRNLFRTLLVMPLVIPVASTVLFWSVLFDDNGILNYALYLLNSNTYSWMNSDMSILVVLVVYLWKNVGYGMVLFIGGLQNIPAHYYELSYIEGANRWQRFFKITWVYLLPTTFFVFIMSIINSFKVFREVYLLAGDYPNSRIYMLQHYMNNTFNTLDYQKLTSAAVVMVLLIYVLVQLLFIVERRLTRNFY